MKELKCWTAENVHQTTDCYESSVTFNHSNLHRNDSNGWSTRSFWHSNEMIDANDAAIVPKLELKLSRWHWITQTICNMNSAHLSSWHLIYYTHIHFIHIHQQTITRRMQTAQHRILWKPHPIYKALLDGVDDGNQRGIGVIRGYRFCWNVKRERQEFSRNVLRWTYPDESHKQMEETKGLVIQWINWGLVHWHLHFGFHSRQNIRRSIPMNCYSSVNIWTYIHAIQYGRRR